MDLIMNKRRCITLPLLLAGILSCSPQGVLKDVKTELKAAERSASIGLDKSFSLDLAESAQCTDIQIVNDSILVLMTTPTEADPYFFKAYSINTLEYLGSAVMRGRGPEEMEAARIIKCCSPEGNIIISDNSVSECIELDILGTIASNKLLAVADYKMPEGAIDFLPLPDGKSFSLILESGLTTYQTTDASGRVLSKFNLQKELSTENAVTLTSSVLTAPGEDGKLAMAMLFFPQIAIFDTQEGECYSVATAKEYTSWESPSPLDFNTVQHYMNICSSKDFIFASYLGLPLSRLISGDCRTGIHVFDWDGDFLLDIKLEENISSMAFDSVNNMLYALDASTGRPVRYNLELLH